jgi:hypothetical protein
MKLHLSARQGDPSTQQYSRRSRKSVAVLKAVRERPRMGATHFLTRKLAGVSAEMSLNVLAYNLKRVMTSSVSTV